MLALGISPLRIGWSVTGTGLLLMVAVVGFQESVAPYTDQLAYKRRVLATSGLESFVPSRVLDTGRSPLYQGASSHLMVEFPLKSRFMNLTTAAGYV